MRKSRNQPTCKILSRKLWFWRDLLKMVDTRQQLKEHSWQINYGEILSFPFWAGLGFLSKGGFNRFSLWYTFQLIFFNVLILVNTRACFHLKVACKQLWYIFLQLTTRLVKYGCVSFHSKVITAEWYWTHVLASMC